MRKISQRKTLTRSVVVVATLVLSVSLSGPAKSEIYPEDEYIYTLEETYSKFIQENTGKTIAYLNMSNNNYYNTTIIDETGNYYEITQQKNGENWEWRTRKCKPQLQEEKIECEEKTNTNPVWEKKTVTEIKNTLSWIMLEPITLTSFIIGDSKPVNIKLTHEIKPGNKSNHYKTTYISNTLNQEGTLSQEVSQNTYILKLEEKKPHQQGTLIIVNIVR